MSERVDEKYLKIVDLSTEKKVRELEAIAGIINPEANPRKAFEKWQPSLLSGAEKRRSQFIKMSVVQMPAFKLRLVPLS